MAKIALKVRPIKMTAELVSQLRKVAPALPMSSISAAIAGNRPVFELTLFDRKDPGFCSRLLALFKYLEQHEVGYDAYQVRGGEEFDESKSTKYYEIDSHRLERIISSRKESLEMLYDAIDLEIDEPR